MSALTALSIVSCVSSTTAAMQVWWGQMTLLIVAVNIVAGALGPLHAPVITAACHCLCHAGGCSGSSSSTQPARLLPQQQQCNWQH